MNKSQKTKTGIAVMIGGFISMPLLLGISYGFEIDSGKSFEDTERIATWLWPALVACAVVVSLGAALAVLGMMHEKTRRKK